MNSTLKYYSENAIEFALQTQNIDFSEIRNLFTKLLPSNACILDFGCGAGRDTKAFLLEGFEVDAMDGCPELCKIASDYCGIDVNCKLFSELNAVEKYNGIWACSSILHLEKNELVNIFNKISNALKKDGILYTSFKYGKFCGLNKGRYFTNFVEKTFDEFIVMFSELKVLNYLVTNDVRKDRENEKWLNILIRKI